MADATRRLFLIAAGGLAAAAAPAVVTAAAPAITLADRERALITAFRQMNDRRKKVILDLLDAFAEVEQEERRA